MSDCGRCWKCKEGRGCIRGVKFGRTNLPSARNQAVTKIVKTDAQWDKDMPAYKRLRHNGIQPKRIDDSAELETRADEQYEVEMAQLVPKHARARVEEGLAIVQQMEQADNKPKVVYPDEQ